MVGWMDDEALHRTLTTGRATYWSRSRQEYWVKGDTSGHVQHVRVGARSTATATPLLVKVDQVGAACHTGDRTCFDADACSTPTSATPRGDAARPVSVSRPDLEAFRELAARPPGHPGHPPLLADGETPVGVYRKLAGERPGTFLLESAEHGRVWSRYSFVGVRSRATLTERDGAGRLARRRRRSGVPTDGDPLDGAARRRSRRCTPRGCPDLPPLTGGLVGYLGYDVVRRLERLPDLADGRPAAARAGHAARHRPRRARPLRTARCC